MSHAQIVLLDEAIRYLEDLRAALADIAFYHDDKYLLTNAVARARHACAQARLMLKELQQYHIGGR